MGNLLIKNGLVVTEDRETICDLYCEDGRIREIGPGLSAVESAPNLEVIDARGLVVVPGGVDVHTHLCLDVGTAVVSDDFWTGTVAAAWGGTTTVVDHPGFGPAGCPLDYQIRKYHDLARGRAVIDYGFHGVIQHVDEDILRSMAALVEEGISSFKIYLTYGFKIPDEGAFRLLEEARRLGVLIACHPENDEVITLLRRRCVEAGNTTPHYHPLSRPPECEAEAINRMILFAGLAGDAPLYIVHLSSALGLSFIQAARNRALRGGSNRHLYAETCPQYLFLEDSRYDLPGIEGLKYLMSPPLRTKADNEALLEALQGDIDTVATDHCPFFFETQKVQGRDDFTQCPNGVPGVEERIPLLFSEGVVKKRISLRRFVELCSTTPAKLFGLYPQKGVLRRGSDADITLLDPEKRVRIRHSMLHAHVDYSVYEGMEVQGWPMTVISRGKVLVREGRFFGCPGDGRFLPRGLPRLECRL